MQSVLEANDIYRLNFKLQGKEVVVENEATKEIQIHINKSSIIMSFMSNLINVVLNNMEYFALHFKHKTADESVVYQSLHQSYLEMVPYFYYYIANQNTDSSDKLYTNVIWLFCEWRNRKEAQDEDRSIKSSSVQSHGTIIENK